MFDLISCEKIRIIQSSDKSGITESLIRIVRRTRILDFQLCSINLSRSIMHKRVVIKNVKNTIRNKIGFLLEMMSDPVENTKKKKPVHCGVTRLHVKWVKFTIFRSYFTVITTRTTRRYFHSGLLQAAAPFHSSFFFFFTNPSENVTRKSVYITECAFRL